MKRFLSTEASERLTARNPAEHYILTYDTHIYYPRGNHFGWLSPSLSVSKKPDLTLDVNVLFDLFNLKFQAVWP